MPFDPRSVLLVSGQLYVVMALAVLAILYHRHDKFNLVVWTVAGVFMGLMAILLSVRGIVPDWMSFPLANLVGYAAYAMKIQVLRLERGVGARWGRAVLMWMFASGLYLVAWGTEWPASNRLLATGVVQMAGSALVAAQAQRLARQLDSLSVRLLAWSFVLMALSIAVRMGRTALGLNDGLPISPEPDYMAMIGAALLSSMFGNIGYMGMALDRARLRDQAQREALDRLVDLQRVQEQTARARAAVRGERYRSAQVLAHEVRQPLHNAAVSLQAATAALAELPAASDARRAMAQAQAVIRRVSASLDNTVAAASLLTSDERVVRQEVDLAMLVDLCIADLPPEARVRVRVRHLADARSASMALGLVRLALRNLLMNATQYAPPDTPVTLRLLDSDEPLALVLEVVDQGPGVPPDVRAALLDPDGSPPPHSVAPGHGLGLHIVQRVAGLHGGSLDWQGLQPSGSVFRLTLPQASPD